MGPLGPWIVFGLAADNTEAKCAELFTTWVDPTQNTAQFPSPGLSSVQLHDGEEIICHLTLTVQEVASIDDGGIQVLPEDSSVKFPNANSGIWIFITAHQWNESLPPVLAN